VRTRLVILGLALLLASCTAPVSAPPAPTYTVTYDANGAIAGTVPVDTGRYHAGEIATVLGNPGGLSRSGATFNGWDTTTLGDGTLYTQGQPLTLGSADIVLYAKWTTNPTYTVIYDGNSNTGGSVPVDSTSYEQSQTVTVLGNTGTLSRTGYAFVGWNTQSDGLGTTYPPGATFAMNNGATLFAKWAPVYTVTYSGNSNTGGSVPVDSNQYQQGATITVLANTGSLTRTGFVFVGWNTLSSGLGTTYQPSATFSMGSSAVTLYAKWAPIYTVTYSGNTSTGGTVPVDSTQYQQGATVTVRGNTGSLVKTGYTFDGWNTQANGSGTPYAANATFAMGSANVTLYAQWTLNTYTVTYNSNGATSGSVPVDGNAYSVLNPTVTVASNTGTLAKNNSLIGFDGWNTAADGSGTSYSGGQTFTIGSANVTLYAQWGTWTHLIPGGSYAVNGIFASGSIVLAATDSGLFQSSTGGSTWTTSYTTSTTGFPSNTVRNVIYGSSEMYVATPSGLGVSVNSGGTWATRTTSNGLANNNVFSVFRDNTTIYAGTLTGLSYSTNSGSSWTTLTALGSVKVNSVWASGSSIYAATDTGLYISTNSGANWSSAIQPATGYVNGVWVSGTHIYLAIGQASSGGVAISTDLTGSSWNVRKNSTGSNLGTDVITGIYVSGSKVYASTALGFAFSLDTGSTWYNTSLGTTTGVFVDGTTVYVPTSGSGLYVLK